MFNNVSDVFSSGELSPHGLCLLWRPDLIWLHVISDSIITIAYYSIPLVLIHPSAVPPPVRRTRRKNCSPPLTQQRQAQPQSLSASLAR